MITIGCGNTGAKIALMFDENPIILSTADQDTENYKKLAKVHVFSHDGASKRFRAGMKIWEKNIEKLRESLYDIQDEKVIIFSALGGGSGSSSLRYVSEILVDQGCKVLIAGILPFIRENNPPLANAVQAINSLMPIISDVSMIIFDNHKLFKIYDGDWQEINEHILKQIDYIINLLRVYNSGGYSPMTLDQSELESVVFGGGFVDISDTFIEERSPKFEYGSMNRDTKNCLICMFVDRHIEEKEKVDKYQKTLTQVVNKYAGRIPNARMIPGILRGKIRYTNSEDENITDRCYLTIASGLSIEKYLKKIEKIRNKAIEKAEAFSEKTKSEKVIGRKESKLLDI